MLEMQDLVAQLVDAVHFLHVAHIDRGKAGELQAHDLLEHADPGLITLAPDVEAPDEPAALVALFLHEYVDVRRFGVEDFFECRLSEAMSQTLK
jgi:hypothetical protein